jgi:hypothetical protein
MILLFKCQNLRIGNVLKAVVLFRVDEEKEERQDQCWP